MRASHSYSLLLRSLLATCLICVAAGAAAAKPVVRDLPPGLQIPAAAQIGAGFDVDKGTQSYLDLLSPEQRQLSDRYFEGGYWLQLWQLLWAVGSCALLLLTGLSRKMNEFSQRASRRRWISTPIYIGLFLVAMFLLGLPLSIYADFLRERQYGLSEQPFGGWVHDQMIGLAADIVIVAVALTCIYAAVRRAGAGWWIWATGLSFVFLMFVPGVPRTPIERLQAAA
jgi:STE24 endopeptidase